MVASNLNLLLLRGGDSADPSRIIELDYRRETDISELELSKVEFPMNGHLMVPPTGGLIDRRPNCRHRTST